jgi:hypothetical protein
MSTSTQAVGGGLAQFDPTSPLNPAALASTTRITIHGQYDPEFRSVSSPQGTDHTTTVRFPDFSVVVPITTRFVLGLSFGTLLDRTSESTQTGLVPVADTSILSTESFKSTGGIEDLRVAAAWSIFPWLHAGLGLHVLTGQNQVALSRTFSDTTVVKALPFSQTSTFSYEGEAVSAGVDIRPSKILDFAASAELGSALRVRRSDTLQSKANVPPRLGAGVKYEGIPGVTLAAQARWDGWSRMQGLGSAGVDPRDAWTFGGGAEVVGPRLGADRNVLLRVGGQTRTLPFPAAGLQVRETNVAAGLGLPFTFQRAMIDASVQRAFRSAPTGFSEAAWMLSVGLTIRP